MKDSGIPWIGEIPEEWKVIPFKAIFKTSKGLSITKDDLIDKGIPVINYGQIHSKTNKGTGVTKDIIRYVPDDYLFTTANALTEYGDFIFADTSEDLDGCGNCCYIDCENKIFAGYHTVLAKSILQNNNKYCAYLFQTPLWRYQIRSEAKGIKVYSITQRMLNNTLVILPSIKEQEKITSFLDTKCSEIDGLIEVEQKMIDELEAYRQATITKVVTQGLNSEVPMQKTAFSWMPQIPKHWTLKRLRFLGTTQNGISRGGSYFGEGYPFVNYGDVYNNIFLPEHPQNLAKSTPQDQEIYSIKEGDVLFTRTSETIEEIGFSAACRQTIDKATFSGFLIRFRPTTSELHSGYSGYYFRSNIHRSYFVKEMNLVTRASLSQNLLRNLPVLLPPLPEQQAIADYLDSKCKEIDDLIEVKRQKIETLKQYRQSIIFEAVTGKLNLN